MYRYKVCDSPAENGRKASLLKNWPWEFRKCPGLKVSGVSHSFLSFSTEDRLVITTVPCMEEKEWTSTQNNDLNQMWSLRWHTAACSAVQGGIVSVSRVFPYSLCTLKRRYGEKTKICMGVDWRGFLIMYIYISELFLNLPTLVLPLLTFHKTTSICLEIIFFTENVIPFFCSMSFFVVVAPSVLLSDPSFFFNLSINIMAYFSVKLSLQYHYCLYLKSHSVKSESYNWNWVV